MKYINSLSSEKLKFFEDNGYLIIEPVEEIIELTKIILNNINMVGRLYCDNFCLENPITVKNVNKKGFYKTIRNPLILYKLLCSKSLQEVLIFLGIKIPKIGPSAIRIDIREEQNHQFHWHQDSPSLLGSINMNTYWIPCTKVGPSQGTIEIIPKSHKKLILETLDARDQKIAGKMNSSNLILNSDVIEKLGEKKIITAEIGSIVILHPLLVHRSYYPDNSHPTRVTCLIRIDDIGDKEHIKLGAKTIMDGFNIFNSAEYINYYKKKTCQI